MRTAGPGGQWSTQICVCGGRSRGQVWFCSMRNPSGQISKFCIHCDTSRLVNTFPLNMYVVTLGVVWCINYINYGIININSGIIYINSILYFNLHLANVYSGLRVYTCVCIYVCIHALVLLATRYEFGICKIPTLGTIF